MHILDAAQRERLCCHSMQLRVRLPMRCSVPPRSKLCIHPGHLCCSCSERLIPCPKLCAQSCTPPQDCHLESDPERRSEAGDCQDATGSHLRHCSRLRARQRPAQPSVRRSAVRPLAWPWRPVPPLSSLPQASPGSQQEPSSAIAHARGGGLKAEIPFYVLADLQCYLGNFNSRLLQA